MACSSAAWWYRWSARRTFVATDLGFLGVRAGHLHAANPHLVPFIAHDRAGFGGALVSAALAIVTLSAWGWRRGSAWVWWTLAGASAAGFAPAVAVHMVIGYTSGSRLAPVYLGIAFTVAALALSPAWSHSARLARQWGNQ